MRERSHNNLNTVTREQLFNSSTDGGGAGITEVNVFEQPYPFRPDNVGVEVNGDGKAQLKDSGVTDAKLGNRTADDTTSHSSATGTLTQLLSLLAKLIKGITGKASFLTAPAITLESLSAHKTRHQSGGADAIKLDDLATPDDNTDLNATSSAHGLLPKLSGSTSDVLLGDGTFGSPPAGSEFNIVKLVSANQSVPSGNTVANTTTETTFSSIYTIPAGTLYVGCVVRIKVWGVVSSTSATPTLTLRIKIGGTTYLSTGALTLPSLTNAGYVIEGSFICFASGGSGSLDAQGIATSPGWGSTNMGNTAPISFATNVSNNIVVTAQWSAASTSNTITMRQLLVELIKM